MGAHLVTRGDLAGAVQLAANRETLLQAWAWPSNPASLLDESAFHATPIARNASPMTNWIDPIWT